MSFNFNANNTQIVRYSAHRLCIFCKTFVTLDTDECPVHPEAETAVEVPDSDDDWASDSSEVSSVLIFEPRSNDDVLESLETDLNQVLYSTSSLPSALVK